MGVLQLIILALTFMSVCVASDALAALRDSIADIDAATQLRVPSIDKMFINEMVKPKYDEAPKTSSKLCSTGPCCTNGKIALKGEACRLSSGCHAAGTCDGFFSQCFSAPVLPDGTACYAGKCRKGVCIATTQADLVQEQKVKLKAKQLSEKKAVVINLPPSPQDQPRAPSLYTPNLHASIPPNNLLLPPAEKQDISKLLPGQTLPPLPGTLPNCKEGGCCDSYGQIKPTGVICEESENDCIAASDVCDGINPTCARQNKPDGALCIGGNCKSGVCYNSDGIAVSDAKDTPTAPKTIVITLPPTHNVEYAQDAALKAEMESLARRNEIKRIQNKLAARRNALGNLIDAKQEHMRLAKEYDMHTRAYFPYEMSNHVAQMENTGEFKIHDYIKKLTQQKKMKAMKAARNLWA